MVQLLRALALFKRTWIQFQGPTWQLTAMYNVRLKGSDALVWPAWALGIYVVHRHTCRQNTHAYTIWEKSVSQLNYQNHFRWIPFYKSYLYLTKQTINSWNVGSLLVYNSIDAAIMSVLYSSVLLSHIRGRSQHPNQLAGNILEVSLNQEETYYKVSSETLNSKLVRNCVYSLDTNWIHTLILFTF